ncbi:hypothetical protein D7J07_04705 [Salmonella enterica]|nr:hypothetical protein [Salmonella enterica]EAQ6297313.1 hypothetical protein [Salmonella enterica]EAU3035895.1 hypothetical protein [Salmonella enterica]EBV7758119.1 hypothetical protein [Salmonella enterica subsp. enterica serovar Salford]
MAAFAHPSHVLIYAPGDSFSCRLDATRMILCILFPRTHNHQEYIQFLPEHSHYSLFSAGLFFYLLMLCTGI